jgi:hypothetical protein
LQTQGFIQLEWDLSLKYGTKISPSLTRNTSFLWWYITFQLYHPLFIVIIDKNHHISPFYITIYHHKHTIFIVINIPYITILILWSQIFHRCFLGHFSSPEQGIDGSGNIW